ncbi:hypothetical protein QQS45_12040 [Alteriqipengyuania flavescens]|nr:hypothetical protein [Alteriqipengyuania flavescens]WJY18339.1 hypothetical protein QQW98_12035 [Alteriqipengyuania flavescens]WJY24280.1 hypothetical protein QQS45_12040 [Alteriqipengyuania flavescens]
MPEIAALLMIVSGAIHASVNAVLKSGPDKLASRALINRTAHGVGCSVLS